MPFNSTPTDDLINETAQMYVLLMGTLLIPCSVEMHEFQQPRMLATRLGLENHIAIRAAVIYWHEAIAAPLADAYGAMVALDLITHERAQASADRESLAAMTARRDIKRIKAIVAECDAKVRRELLVLSTMN